MKVIQEITPTYSELLKSPEWLRKRKVIINRDNGKCCNCDSTKFLQVHHKQYHFIKSINQFKSPWDYNHKYLITLCSECHEVGHNKYTVKTFNV